MKKKIQIILLLLIILFTGFSLIQKINLCNSDLGRHLKNGEYILTTHSIPENNLYSYTHPNFPVLYHHWGSGVVFHLIHKKMGFPALVLCNALLFSAALFFLSFSLPINKGVPVLPFLLLILYPLLISRKEIRPEVFSYLFTALVFYILNSRSKIRYKWILIPLIQFLWINLHIFFMLGFFIQGAFWIDQFIKNKAKKIPLDMSLIIAISLIVSLLNPYTWKGLLLPFGIFQAYAYKVAENQSVIFMIKGGFFHFYYLVFFLISFIAGMLFVLNPREKLRFHYSILMLFFFIMSLLINRMMIFFALISIPIIYDLSLHIKNTYQKALPYLFLCALLLMLLLSFFFFTNSYGEKNKTQRMNIKLKNWVYNPVKDNFGAGLMPGNLAALNFIREHKIPGLIFNNYDVGSYLIYGLYPWKRVFVDNRPEAYPVSFFKKQYVPAQENYHKWQVLNDLYCFNMIFFYRHDMTEWGQHFLIERLHDPEWAPVYVDDYCLIYLRRNAINKTLIDRYELPKSMFRVVKNR